MIFKNETQGNKVQETAALAQYLQVNTLRAELEYMYRA